MQTNNSEQNNLFQELSSFGLNSVIDTEVYSVMTQNNDEPQKNVATQENAIRKNIYLKSFRCPVCGKETQIPTIKSSGVRLIRKDTDFMPIYQDPNPLYYYITFCSLCGFASMPANMKNISSKQKSLILEKISSTWQFNKTYPEYYTPEVAIEIHKLGLLNAIISNDKESLRAIISLHIGWLYRILGDEKNEKVFLSTAMEGFVRAYEHDSGPVGGMNHNTQQLLIAELKRRTGDLKGSMNWYQLVLLDKNASYALKETAREQKDVVIKALNLEASS